MKSVCLPFITLIIMLPSATLSFAIKEHKRLPTVENASGFTLNDTDGNTHALASSAKSKLQVTVSTCDHCTGAQAYQRRVIQLANDYRSKLVPLIVKPNWQVALPYTTLCAQS